MYPFLFLGKLINNATSIDLSTTGFFIVTLINCYINYACVQFFVPGNSLEIPWSNNCQSNFQQHCLTVMCKRFWSTINVRRYQRSFDTKLKCWLQRNGLKNPGSGTSLVLKWLIFLIFWCTHHRFNLDSNSCKENQVC